MNPPSQDHMTEEEILEYVSNTSSELDMLDADSHLACCDECTNRVRILSYVRRNFDQLWGSWTAAEHGRARQEWRLMNLVAEATSTQTAPDPASWLERIEHGSLVAVKILLDHAERLAGAGALLLKPGQAWTCPAMAAGVAGEAIKHLTEGSHLLSEGRVEEAKAEFQAARGFSQDAVLDVLTGSTSVLSVAVVSARKEVSVEVKGSSGCDPGFALLIPTTAPQKSKRASFDKSGQGYLATFKDVEDGEFELVLSL